MGLVYFQDLENVGFRPPVITTWLRPVSAQEVSRANPSLPAIRELNITQDPAL